MTQTLEFKQIGQLESALSDPATKQLKADKIIGRWANTNPDTDGVAEITIEQDGDHFFVSITGAGDGESINWPRTEAIRLANLEEEAGQRAIALMVDFDFGFMKAETYLRVNKGVLVIVAYHTFLDSSRRSNYVNREFFYRRD